MTELGDDEATYDKVCHFYKDCHLCSYGRGIILSPSRKELPKLTLMIQGTCNRFTSVMVRQQWDQIKELYDKHLLEVIGPLLGHPSDGDARRRHEHRADLLNTIGERYGLV